MPAPTRRATTGYPAASAGREEALSATQFTGVNIVCGGGRMANSRQRQASFWFQDWDPGLPVDSLYAGANYLTCSGADAGGGAPPRGSEIQRPDFTPEENSSELLVGGDLHGVLDVSHCGALQREDLSPAGRRPQPRQWSSRRPR